MKNKNWSWLISDYGFLIFKIILNWFPPLDWLHCTLTFLLLVFSTNKQHQKNLGWIRVKIFINLKVNVILCCCGLILQVTSTSPSPQIGSFNTLRRPPLPGVRASSPNWLKIASPLRKHLGRSQQVQRVERNGKVTGSEPYISEREGEKGQHLPGFLPILRALLGTVTS